MVPVGDKLVRAPRNAKELMATRLMEGHFVRCSCRGIQVCAHTVSCICLSHGEVNFVACIPLVTDVTRNRRHGECSISTKFSVFGVL